MINNKTGVIAGGGGGAGGDILMTSSSDRHTPLIGEPCSNTTTASTLLAGSCL